MKKENKIELEKTIKNSKTIFNVLIAIIVTTITVLLFSSCTADTSQSNTNPNPTNCLCGIVVESTSFNIVGPDGLHQFSVLTMKNNCTGVFKQIQRDGVIRTGTQICNY